MDLDWPTDLPHTDSDVAPEELVAWTLERFSPDRMVLTTSFGMEGCALLDMYAVHDRPLAVVYFDTMFLFPETYRLRDRLMQRYPNLRFVNRGTSLTPTEQDKRYGPELWRRDPDTCCRLRKVDPLRRVLAGAEAWVSAITRTQSAARRNIRQVEWSTEHSVHKVSPLAGWDRARVWEYVQENDVPHNELHERGYPSIGCTHCTVSVPGVLSGEYTRAGRWPGNEKTECGLHIDVGEG